MDSLKKGIWIPVLGLTLLIEGVTLLFRFGFDIQATRDTAGLADFTGGLRIHHGYIGVAAMLVGYLLWRKYPKLARLGVILGLALFASDMIHHFVVLWLVVGDPEFHLIYSTGR